MRWSFILWACRILAKFAVSDRKEMEAVTSKHRPRTTGKGGGGGRGGGHHDDGICPGGAKTLLSPVCLRHRHGQRFFGPQRKHHANWMSSRLVRTIATRIGRTREYGHLKKRSLGSSTLSRRRRNAVSSRRVQSSRFPCRSRPAPRYQRDPFSFPSSSCVRQLQVMRLDCLGFVVFARCGYIAPAVGTRRRNLFTQ